MTFWTLGTYEPFETHGTFETDGTQGHLGYIYEALGTYETLATLEAFWGHIPSVITNVIFLVKCSISKVSTVHNVGSKLGHSPRYWPVIINALLDKYLAQKETQDFENALNSCNLLKTFRLI